MSEKLNKMPGERVVKYLDSLEVYVDESVEGSIN